MEDLRPIESDTDKRLFHQLPAVDVGTVQFDFQCSRKCSLRVSGVGAGVTASLGDSSPEGSAAAPAGCAARKKSPMMTGIAVVRRMGAFIGRFLQRLSGR